MGGFHGRPAYADVDAGAALAVMRNRIVHISAGGAIDQIVADDPGMVARRSRLMQLVRSGQGSPYWQDRDCRGKHAG